MVAPVIAATCLCTIALALLFSFRSRLSGGFLSPVALVPMAYVAMAIGGGLAYGKVQNAPNGASIVLDLNGLGTDRTVIILLVSASCVALGGLAFLALSGKLSARNLRPQLPPPSAGLRKLVLLVALVVLLALVGGEGFSSLLDRPIYIADHVDANGLLTLGSTLATPSILALGYVLAASAPRTRWAPTALFLLFIVTAFSLGSRQLALFPVVFTIGTLLTGGRKRWKYVLLAAMCGVSLVLIHLSLYLRIQNEHGLLPYLGSLGAYSTNEIPPSAVGRNLLTPFAVVAYSAFGPNFPGRDFWVSINPAPGGWAGWYEIASSHRLNYFTPMAGIGELRNYGWSKLILFMLVTGAVLGYFEGRLAAMALAGRNLIGMAYIGLAAIFAFVSLSYNLRSSTRYLYYGLAIDLVFRFALVLLRRRSDRGTRPDSHESQILGHARGPIASVAPQAATVRLGGGRG